MKYHVVITSMKKSVFQILESDKWFEKKNQTLYASLNLFKMIKCKTSVKFKPMTQIASYELIH